MCHEPLSRFNSVMNFNIHPTSYRGILVYISPSWTSRLSWKWCKNKTRCVSFYIKGIGGSFSPETCCFCNPPILCDTWVGSFVAAAEIRCEILEHRLAVNQWEPLLTDFQELCRQRLNSFLDYSQRVDLWYINCFLERKALQLRSHVDFLLNQRGTQKWLPLFFDSQNLG